MPPVEDVIKRLPRSVLAGLVVALVAVVGVLGKLVFYDPLLEVRAETKALSNEQTLQGERIQGIKERLAEMKR